MNFYEHNLPYKDSIRVGNKLKWILEESNSYMKRNKDFTKAEYLKNRSEYLHFSDLEKEFYCQNCKSENVECIWYEYNGIATRVDETFAEFYCLDCRKFTFVEYSRDDS